MPVSFVDELRDVFGKLRGRKRLWISLIVDSDYWDRGAGVACEEKFQGYHCTRGGHVNEWHMAHGSDNDVLLMWRDAGEWKAVPEVYARMGEWNLVRDQLKDALKD